MFFHSKLVLFSFIFVYSDGTNFGQDLAHVLRHVIDSDYELTNEVLGTTYSFPDKYDYKILGEVQVETANGIVYGSTLDEAHAFNGIPYGKSTAGINRYKPPVAIENYPDGVFNGTQLSHVACIQRGRFDEHSTEDCLVVNVHVPKSVNLADSNTPPTDKLPVLFWIHGGAFFFGEGTNPIYDGRYLAKTTGAIIVTANYRLGSLGFLVYSDENETINGNQGLKDQQLALKWVQQNIYKFGGDKDKVTLFGNSAGAQSVMFHLLSDVSAPMFHQAIQQSNPAVYKYKNLEEAKVYTERLLNASGCTDQGIECLRNISSDQAANYDIFNVIECIRIDQDIFGAIEPFRPVIDGVEYTGDPLKQFQQGAWQTNKKLILGTTEDEVIFLPVLIPEAIPIIKSIFVRLNQFVFGEKLGTQIADFYIDKYGGVGPRFDYQYILGDEMGDCFFVCPTRTLARLATHTASPSSNVHLYLFSQGMSCGTGLPGGTCGYAGHGGDVRYLFRTSHFTGYNFTDEDWQSSDQFSYFWGNFAHAGDPNSGDVTSVASENFPDWPIYDEVSWENLRIISPSGEVQSRYKDDVCDFWDSTGYFVDMTSSTTEGPETVSPSQNPTSTTEPTSTMAPTMTSLPETTTPPSNVVTSTTSSGSKIKNTSYFYFFALLLLMYTI